MAIDATLEDAIYDFIASASGLTPIWAYPDTDRPPLPYITMNISSGPSKVGEVTERRVSEDVFKYHQVWRFTLSINVYSLTNHMECLTKIITATSLPSKIEILRLAGLAVWGPPGPTTDITELLNTSFEPRGHVDLFMSYGEETNDTVGEIHTVTSDYDLSENTGSITTTID